MKVTKITKANLSIKKIINNKLISGTIFFSFLIVCIFFISLKYFILFVQIFILLLCDSVDVFLFEKSMGVSFDYFYLVEQDILGNTKQFSAVF